MTTPLAEQPEDVRARPAAVTIIGVIAGIAGSVVIVWLLLGLDAHGGGRTNPVPPIALPTSQPYMTMQAPKGPTPLEQRRAAEHASIDEWLPAEIDRYVSLHTGGQR